MGGVDLLDRLVSHYRIYIKSRKWPLRMFAHALDVACVNSWLEYRAACKKVSIPARKQLDLMHFRIQLAEGLIKCNRTVAKRNTRSSYEVGSESPVPNKKSKIETRPLDIVKFDTVDHIPDHDGKKEPTRCKNPGCTSGRSHYFCLKCKVHLCLCRQRNCFKQFHTMQ